MNSGSGKVVFSIQSIGDERKTSCEYGNAVAEGTVFVDLLIGGRKITLSDVGAPQETVDLICHDSINPGVGRGPRVQVEDLKFAHSPRRVTSLEGSNNAGKEAKEGVGQIGRTQEEEELVEGVLAHVAVGNDTQKDDDDCHAENKQKRAVNDPHYMQPRIVSLGSNPVGPLMILFKLAPVNGMRYVGFRHGDKGLQCFGCAG